MATTTYTWNTIALTQTDGDSPLDETLMEAIRQNLISLEEWLGDGFAQAKDHDHDGVNSALLGTAITPFQLSNMAAGVYQISMNAVERNVTTNTAWVKIKQSKIGASGAYRIRFYCKGEAGGNTRFAIFRNGVMVGIEQSGSIFYIRFSQDISGWAANDLVQIYARNAAGSTALYVKDLEILVDAAHVTLYDPDNY